MATRTKLSELAGIPYFAGLDEQVLDRLQGLVWERVYRRNEVVFLEGDPCEAVFFLMSGKVMILKTSPEGREQVLRVMGPGETFNEVPIFDGGPNPATVQALEQARVLAIGRGELLHLIDHYPQVGMNVLRTFAARLRELTALVGDLSFRHVTGRVARALLQLSDESAASSGAGEPPKLRLTQQELAAMAGTVREVVSRSLRTLEQEGAIRVERHRIVLLDAAKLESFL